MDKWVLVGVVAVALVTSLSVYSVVTHPGGVRIEVLSTGYGVKITDLSCENCDTHISPDKLSAKTEIVGNTRSYFTLNYTLVDSKSIRVNVIADPGIEVGLQGGYQADYYAKSKRRFVGSNLNWSFVGDSYYVENDTVLARYQMVEALNGTGKDRLFDVVVLNDRVWTVGSTNDYKDPAVVVFDRNGDVIHRFKILDYGSNDSIEFRGLASDRYVYAVGHARQNDYDGLIVKLNDKNVLWSLHVDVHNEFLEGVAVGDHIYTVGRVKIGNNYDAFILKIDKNGNLIWAKRIGSVRDDGFYDVALKDGYVYAVGYAYDRWDALVVKFDENGNVVWNVSWTNNTWDFTLYDLVVHGNNVYAVGYAYHYHNPKHRDAYIVKLDLNGNVLWQKIVGVESFNESFSDVIVFKNHIFAFGTIENSSKSYGFVAEFGSNGNLIAQKRIENIKFYGSAKDSDYVYAVGRYENDFTLVKFFNLSRLNRSHVEDTNYTPRDVKTDSWFNYTSHDVSVNFKVKRYTVQDVQIDRRFIYLEECRTNDSIVLTLDRNLMRGSAWINERIDLSKDFSLKAKIYLGFKDGADGVVFVIQNDSRWLSAIGGYGGNLAYNGSDPIVPSIGVEFDTWRNYDYGDPNGNHVALDVNCHHIYINTSVPKLEDGVEHDVTVTWSSKYKTLRVFLDGHLCVERTIDVRSILNGSLAWIGFTGSTGGRNNVQYVKIVNFEAYLVKDVETSDTTLNTSNWHVVGDAYRDNEKIVLTPDERWKRGSAWYGEKIDLSNYLWFEAKVYLGDKDGADGLVFVIHNDTRGLSAIGGYGGNLAYNGSDPIKPSVGIELDTWRNYDFGDPNGNHIGLNVNGSTRSEITRAVPIEDGREHDLIVRWNPKTMCLDAYLDGIHYIHKEIDLKGILGEKAIIGFTASTGGSSNEHYVKIVKVIESSDVRDISKYKETKVYHVAPGVWVCGSDDGVFNVVLKLYAQPIASGSKKVSVVFTKV